MKYTLAKPAKPNMDSVSDRAQAQMLNNEGFYNGFYLLKIIKTSGDKTRQDEFNNLCLKIREYDRSYRGTEAQRSVFDAMARKECKLMGINFDGVVARSSGKIAEPKDHAKAAANDKPEPSFETPQKDMFNDAKKVRVL